MDTQGMTAMEFLAAESRREQEKLERFRRARAAAPELVDALRGLLQVSRWNPYIKADTRYQEYDTAIDTARELLERVDGKEQEG